MPAEQFRNGRFDWSVFVEEVERLRPATYPDEPRYGSRDDKLFAETGPRFAARLQLKDLKPVLPEHTTQDEIQR